MALIQILVNRCGAQNKDHSTVSQTDITRVLFCSVAQVARIVAVTVIYAFRPFVLVVSVWRYLCDTSLRDEIY